jgi:hypothetical protein
VQHQEEQNDELLRTAAEILRLARAISEAAKSPT